MRMFGSLKHGGDKSLLAGGPHYLLTSLEVLRGAEGLGKVKKKLGATEKGRGEAAKQNPGG